MQEPAGYNVTNEYAYFGKFKLTGAVNVIFEVATAITIFWVMFL